MASEDTPPAAISGQLSLQRMLDHLDICVYTKDPAGRYTYVNNMVCRVLGRPRASILGQTDADLHAGETAGAMRHNDAVVLAHARAVAAEEVIELPATGERRHFWSIKQPLFGDGGEVVGLAGVSTDISARKRQEQELIDLKNRLAATLQAMPDLVFELERDGRFIACHTPREALLAVPAEQLLGRTVQDILPPDVAGLCMQALAEAELNGLSGGQQFRLDVPGGERWFELSVSCRPGQGDQCDSFIVLSRDITDRRLAEQALRERESLLRAIVDNTPVEYWARDLQGRCIMENSRVVEHWGSLLGTLPHQASVRDSELELWQQNNRRAYAGEVVDQEVEYLMDGERRVFQNLVAPIRVEGEIVGIVGFNQDITERKQAEEQVRTLAFYDSLTQLPNRRLMFERLNHAVASASRRNTQGALLLIDLDNFKLLNDTAGHDAGDRLLVAVAERLRHNIRSVDTASRLGGDEFVVILEDAESEEGVGMQVERVALKLQQALSEPYDLEVAPGSPKVNFHTSCSIGITLFSGGDASAEELLRRADTAMYQAKAAGRGSLCFYDPGMQAAVAARAEIDADLRASLQQQQLALHYQLQVDAGGRAIGAEALLRWQHPKRGMVSPAEFIPVAEETGFIVQIGRWVLECACEQLARWSLRAQTAHLTLAVNVSARQFRQPDFSVQLRSILERTQAPAHRLKLELTESLLLEHTEDVIQRMFELRGLGISFSLDDFGTGYSSLVYLKRLPIDQLKIDQSFVRDVLTDPSDAAIVRTIIALGNSLGLDVIAEGVETEEQREFLRQSGCEAYQGYLFSRPVPSAQLEQRLLCA